MNVLLVSQCDKRALTETRRILDQFAERRGERTWQTPITQAGLDTLRKLLRKTARKNTAVACHWIRGMDHSELLWIVGDARRFNSEGAVPTNTTARDVLRKGDENDWHTAQDIRLLAQLAALLHDLGKASVAFQQRLAGKLDERNRYRHEWVSLRLFLAFVGEDDDAGWLARLASDENGTESEWTAKGRYLRDGVDPRIERQPFREITVRAPLAAAIGWLIVTHHRLPVIPCKNDDGSQAWLGKRVQSSVQANLEAPLAQVAHDWNEIDQRSTAAQAMPYWQLAGELPAIAPAWRTQARRVAKALLELRTKRDADWLENPYVMHLARLALMLADHHYSSLGLDKDDQAVSARSRFKQDNQNVFANTTKNKCGRVVNNQSLLEHLLGVGYGAGQIAHALPNFERHLPRLANHRGLRKRSADKRFAWQDTAFDAAAGIREAAREHGAFIVNMASTGCGKTLANARILYALADPQLGLRASYALGLRTLTLQTGKSYRHDLGLNDDKLAVLVGGSANRDLFLYHEARAEAGGSASIQALIEEDSHVLYEGNVADHPLLSRALANPDIARLISAPMLVCTVDHLAPATESLRAGRQIAPMLRLMSSDLVLDELDDYDLDDLPALTRLMHWAGMLGARVVLSSATLPPALVQGMFLAYRAGRRHYRRNRGAEGEQRAGQVEIPCLWADEFHAVKKTCADAAVFSQQHNTFVERRAKQLGESASLRRGELVSLSIELPQGIDSKRKKELIHFEFARQVRDACQRLHHDHAETDPVTGKRVSFGIVRMANIEPLFEVAKNLIEQGTADGTRIHLCVYHSRFPLALRSAIEHQLDTTFNRRSDGGQGVYRLPSIRAALDTHPERDHLFVVLASPVCEVGRDWDADWAVAEPSSMRSLIQLAGRVQRHRGKAGDKANVLIFDTNLRYFADGKADDGSPAAIYVRPGFEKQGAGKGHPFRLLPKRRLGTVLMQAEFTHLSALPRILPRSELQSSKRLVDLEHARMTDAMLPKAGLNAATAWNELTPQVMLTGVLPQQQPFRDDPRRTETLVFLPIDDDETFAWHRIEESLARQGKDPYIKENRVVELHLAQGERVSRWGDFNMPQLLAEHAEFLDLSLEAAAKKLTSVDVPENTQGWNWHPWLGFRKKK